MDSPLKPDPAEGFPRQVPADGADDGAGQTAWDDKETFLRRTFDEDPKKGCELLFRRYYQPMCNHAVRFVYSKEIAHDIVSEIFYCFWYRRLYSQIRMSYRAYLFIAVRNRCLRHLEIEFGRHTQSLEAGDIDILSHEQSPQDTMQFMEIKQHLERAIQALTPQCQRVFLMSRFEGKKYHEIAAELQLSRKTVETHMTRALDMLRKAVSSHLTS